MKKKNKFIPILLIASLVIWGRNIYLMFVPLEESEDDILKKQNQEIVFSRESAGIPDADLSYRYNPGNRDPFQPDFLKNREIIQQPSQTRAQPEPKPPVLLYTGFIGDSRGTMAVVAETNGATHFVRTYDSLMTVRIVRIHEDSLWFSFHKKEYALPLRP